MTSSTIDMDKPMNYKTPYKNILYIFVFYFTRGTDNRNTSRKDDKSYHI